MSVAIPRTRSAPRDAIKRIKQAFGGRPPKDFLSFLERHDAAEPADNVIRLGPGEDTRMQEFIPASEMLKERQAIELFPQHGIPLGYDDVGDYFYISTLNGKVYLWDHERPDFIFPVAPSFDAFLEKLEPDFGV